MLIWHDPSAVYSCLLVGPSKHLCEDAAEHSALKTNWCNAMIRGGMARHIQKIETLWFIPRSNKDLKICVSKNVGIETPEEASPGECNKFQNRNRDLVESVKKIQKFGLQIRGGFIVGFDNDSPSIFDRQVEFIQKSRVITAMVGMLNAPRGSRLYKRVGKEGRLLEGMSGDNTDLSTNIIPKMGYEKLARGYKRIIKGIYSPKPYYERVKAFLKEYHPMEKRFFRLHFGHLRLQVRMVSGNNR
jgi:uncharacterized protein DUF4070